MCMYIYTQASEPHVMYLSDTEILTQWAEFLEKYIQKNRQKISDKQREDGDFLYEEIVQKGYNTKKLNEREAYILRKYIYKIMPEGFLLRADQIPLWHEKKEYDENIKQKWKKIIDEYIEKYSLIKTGEERINPDFLEEIFQDLVRNNSAEDISIFDEYIQLVTAIPLHELYKDPRFVYLKNHGITTAELLRQSDENRKMNQKDQYIEQKSSNPFAFAASVYAREGVFLRNLQYKYYKWKRNCTNFISQALKFWGMQFIWEQSFSHRENPYYWYYNGSFFTRPTHTWWWADNFYSHAGLSPQRYQHTSSLSNLEIGDIIQVDWRKANGTAPDGNIDHTMMVTKKTGNTIHDIYLSYHNHWNYPQGSGSSYPPDAQDKKLSAIIGDSLPSSHMWYMWKVNY